MNRRGRIVDVVLYCMAAMIIGAGVAGVYDVVVHPGLPGNSTSHRISPFVFLRPPLEGIEELRILLVGSDDRANDRGRSDTLMVFYLNPRNKRAALLSIPRDVRVHIPGHGDDKINHAYGYGGVPLVKRCVEQLLGEHIDYYAHATFQMFVDVVDKLGGVDINVPDYEGEGRGMNYDCPGDNLIIHLRPGPQHLDGYKAMGFVRYRKSNVPGKSINDEQRAANQHMFLKAIVEQKLRPANWSRVAQAAGYIMRTLDTDIPWQVAVDLARVLRKMPSGGLLTTTIPIYDDWRNGVYYARASAGGLADVKEQIRRHLLGETTAPVVVEVLNGSGSPGAARAAARLLEEKGFRIASTGNAPSFDHARTVIQYAKDKQQAATKAAEALNAADAECQEGDSRSLGQFDLRIIVGKDISKF